jgi:hypothetical protein
MNKLKFVAEEKLDHIQTEQEIMLVGVITGWTADKIPERPKPPPIMMLREGSMGSCPNCGSSEDKKYWFFGPRKCINSECLLSREWHSKLEARYIRRNY